MRMSLAVVAVAALVAGSVAGRAWASPALVNGSFETPVITPVPGNPYSYALPTVADWTQVGTANNTGTFANTDVGSPDHIVNADGAQLAWIFSASGTELDQDLTDTYQLGQTYHLAVAVCESQGMYLAPGDTLEARLYYHNPAILTGDNRVIVGHAAITNTVEKGLSSTSLVDLAFTTAAVGAGDPWLGQPIGVELVPTVSGLVLDDPNYPGGRYGVWDVDNVRLTAAPVPEPAALTLLALGAVVLVRRRRNA